MNAQSTTWRWTSLTAVGLVGGIGAALVLGGPIQFLVGMMLVTPVVTGVVGAVLGGAQWLHLRHVMVRASWWIGATILGMALGLSGGVVVVEQAGRLLLGHRPDVVHLTILQRAASFAVLGAITGAIVSGFQWLVLRAQLPAVKGWVVTTTAALLIAFVVSSLLVDVAVGGFQSARGVIVFVGVAGLLFGGITSQPLLRVANAR